MACAWTGFDIRDRFTERGTLLLIPELATAEVVQVVEVGAFPSAGESTTGAAKVEVFWSAIGGGDDDEDWPLSGP